MQGTSRRQTPSPWVASPDFASFDSSHPSTQLRVKKRAFTPNEDEASCRAETRHAALIDIVVEITWHGKIISNISTKNHDMLLRGRQIV